MNKFEYSPRHYSIGHSTTSQHNTSQPIMDLSDENTLIMLTMLNNRKNKRKRRIMWCREHFLLRSSRGEFHRTFCSLMTRRDETMFFNYIRMSDRTYEELKNLVLPHLQPLGCNYREPISAEEKLVSHKFNNFFLVVIHFGSTRHKKRAMQQSKARNISSRLCRAFNGVYNSKSLCLIFFRTRAMCCVPCTCILID
ncbi:hypothetical protein PoB_005944900 [Plakobranchus ocellatus]|uniref:Uncharacterized protein n=1 Tax=Plakobranchus ocellatus TaxID=259542 RepID=A0AAV4CJE8_9GAST|nr:hypothetical protein PoB_005944900 [Plakobranchus ocellatus]